MAEMQVYWGSAECRTPPLFGTTIQETGPIWRRVIEFMNRAEPPLMAVVRPVFFGKVDELRGQIDESFPIVREELGLLEEILARDEYLAGGSVTAVETLPSYDTTYPPHWRES